MPGQWWMWVLGILSAVVTIGFAIAGRTWWMIPVALVLGLVGALRIVTAGEFRPPQVTASQVDAVIDDHLAGCPVHGAQGQ